VPHWAKGTWAEGAVVVGLRGHGLRGHGGGSEGAMVARLRRRGSSTGPRVSRPPLTRRMALLGCLWEGLFRQNTCQGHKNQRMLEEREQG